MLGDLYGETENVDLAIDTLAEGVGLLKRVFVAVPTAVAGIMGGLVQSYLKQCESADREPDAEMLGPIIAEMQRLNQRRKTNER